MGVAVRPHAQPTASPPRTHLVIVVDGLRPDDITPDGMPRLTALGRRGVVFNAHHSVFPTVTRVNGASFVTGAYPETHGILGNTIYIPAVNPIKGLDTGSRENLEAVQSQDGKLLTAPSLGEILEQAGKKLLVVSSGSSGSALMLNHTVGSGAIIHTDFTRPRQLAPRVAGRLGPAPPNAIPNAARNHRAVDAYLTLGLDELHPDVTLMWFSDPDTTAHANGTGSEITRKALTLIDTEIGRIEDTLRTRGLIDRTNLIVTSDHGFSTHGGSLKLEALVEPFVKLLPDGSRDIVVAEGSIHLRGTRDPVRVAAIAVALQRRPEVGAIFTRPGPKGGPEGEVPGTLSFDVVRWNHQRAGDILVSANWSREVNAAGVAGKTTQSGVAGHGSSSPYDIHNTLIAAGPDFREHTAVDVPTSNVDLAPTLLRLLGLKPPETMTGRTIEEALRNGPSPSSVRVTRVDETVATRDATYELTAHISIVDGRRYLDFTEVKRK